MRTQLKQNEHITFLTRKHWFALVRPALFLVFSSGALFFIFTCNFDPGITQAINALKQLFAACLAFSVLYFVDAYYERLANIWVVTNLRVIDEWGVFSKNVKESPLQMINNVSHRQTVPGMIFDFGNVEIQTAAEQGATLIRLVSSPVELHDAIMECQDRLRMMDICGGDPSDTVVCPYCAETIKRKANICRFCRRELDNETDSHSNANAVDACSEVARDEYIKEPLAGYNPRQYWR